MDEYSVIWVARHSLVAALGKRKLLPRITLCVHKDKDKVKDKDKDKDKDIDKDKDKDKDKV